MPLLSWPSFDPLPVWIAATALATLFAHAAWAKWADLALFEQQLSVYGLPSHLPTALARLLPLLELLTALLLMAGPWRLLGAGLAAGLLLLYAGAMGYHRWRGHVLDCGCGGEPLPVSWALVLRNLGLAALALFAACGLGPRPMGGPDVAVVAAATALAALLYAAMNQLLRHRAGTHGVRSLFGSSSS